MPGSLVGSMFIDPPEGSTVARITLFGRSDNRDTTTVADILRQETVGGVLMLAAAAVAVIWASLAHESYEAVREFHLGPLSLDHWAGDGLLAIFFFVAGLELKRELTVGSLSRPAEALVPVVAAVCGMAVPAMVFLAINLPTAGGRPEGWAIPMATDIAFALAILAVVGRQLPSSLRAFLLTLAIVDDLGAILIIATVFTSDVRFLWLLAAAGCCALWWLLQQRRIRGWYFYLPLGILTWVAVLNSGVHATIAGVALGMLTRSSASTADHDADGPIDRWEHLWRPVSAGVAVPLFALLAAGVPLAPGLIAELAREPLALGIVAGLVVGKFVGVLGGSYLTARFTRAELAADLKWSEVASVSLLGGVGFTVALLISDLAFANDLVAQEHGKAAVLIGSLIAAVLAAISLRRRSATRQREADTPSPTH